MTPSDAHRAIRAAAKAIQKAPVFLARWEEQPPRTQRTRGGWYTDVDGKARRSGWRQRVIVGREWLRLNLPEVWAALAAERLAGGTLPPFVQGGSRWQWN